MRESPSFYTPKCKHLLYFYYISGKTCVDMLNDDCHFLNVLTKTVFVGLEMNYLSHLLKVLHFLVFGRICKFFLGV